MKDFQVPIALTVSIINGIFWGSFISHGGIDVVLLYTILTYQIISDEFFER